MRVLRQLMALRVLAQARRNRLDLVRALIRRPQLLIGTGLYEAAVVGSARVDAHLKVLAELKVAASRPHPDGLSVPRRVDRMVCVH